MKAFSTGRRLCVGWLLAQSVFTLTTAAHAAEANWPDKPVTIVVSYPPGGMTDIVTRMLAKGLSDEFSQSFIVENRPGAAGQIGTEYVARQPADGYTLLVTATGYVISPFTRTTINYDPRKDLVPLAALVQTPNMIVVNPDVPARSVPEFLAWARQQGSVPYATSGAGGSTHLGGALLKKATGIDFSHVPYRGASPAVADTLGGQIPMAVQDSVSVAVHIRANKLRPIAVTSAQRSAVFPEVPTLREHGFEDFDVYTWLGLFAPAGLPQAVAEKINATTTRIMHSPAMIEALSKQSSEPMPAKDLTQTRAFLESELDKWGKLVKETGIQIGD